MSLADEERFKGPVVEWVENRFSEDPNDPAKKEKALEAVLVELRTTTLAEVLEAFVEVIEFTWEEKLEGGQNETKKEDARELAIPLLLEAVASVAGDVCEVGFEVQTGAVVTRGREEFGLTLKGVERVEEEE